MEPTQLLDSNQTVSTRELVLNMIRAALLSLEKQGMITLEITGTDDGKIILVKPTGKIISYSDQTLEHRLDISETASLSDIVEKWLVEACPSPWTRAIEKGNISLVLRGFANYDLPKMSYAISAHGKAAKNNSKASAEEIRSLISSFAENHPDVMALIDTQIEKAFKNKTFVPAKEEKKDYKAPDPWMNESAFDRNRFKDVPLELKPAKRSLFGSIASTIIICAVWYFFVIKFLAGQFSSSVDQRLVALCIAGVLVIAFLIIQWKKKPLGAFWEKYKTLFLEKKDLKKLIKPTYTFSHTEQFIRNLAGAGVLGIFIHIFYLLISQNILFGIVLLVAAGSYVYVVLQKLAQARISEKVTGRPFSPKETGPEIIQSKTGQLQDVRIPASTQQDISQIRSWNDPVSIDIIPADKLPDVSDESRRKVSAVSNRRTGNYRISKNLLLLLASCTFLVTLAYGLYENLLSGNGTFTAGFIFLCIFYVFTIALTFFWFSRLSTRAILGRVLKIMLKSSNIEIKADKQNAAKKEDYSLHPVASNAFIWIWLFVATSLIGIYDGIGIFWVKLLFIVLSVSIIAGTLSRFYILRNKLEKEYPYEPPFNLLALRVFGSPYLEDFLRLTHKWKWIGTSQRLDGPDTVGFRDHDVVNYLTGRLDKSIVENADELKLAYNGFKLRPDRKLRFPCNSMQCNMETWQNAIQLLLDDADLVVMDLSNLSEKNKGVAFELQKLFDQFPKDNLVLLINDSTDRAVLEEISNKAWAMRSANSPNYKSPDTKICFLHTGVMPEIRNNESIYDWQRRFEKPVDDEKLVCMMYDRSLSSKKKSKLAQAGKKIIHWTRTPLPVPLKIIIKLIFVLFLAKQILLVLI